MVAEKMGSLRCSRVYFSPFGCSARHRNGGEDRGAARFRSGSRLGRDEALWGVGVQEGDEAVAGGGDGATVVFDYDGTGCLIDGNNTAREARPVRREGAEKEQRGPFN